MCIRDRYYGDGQYHGYEYDDMDNLRVYGEYGAGLAAEMNRPDENLDESERQLLLGFSVPRARILTGPEDEEENIMVTVDERGRVLQLDEGSRYGMIRENFDLLFAFEGMWIDIPTPFKKCDIVFIDREKEGFPVTPFVMSDLCTDRETEADKRIYDRLAKQGDISAVSYTHLDVYKRQTYKCIEYYDNTTELRTYLYSDKYAGCPPFDQERGEIEGLGWYSYHFQLAITFDNEKIFGDKELAERLTDLGNEFNGKYDICDNLEEPDSGEFFIDGALRLMSDQLDDFAQDVQKIHDFATEHGLRTDITAEFTEDGSSEQEVFAAISLSPAGGRYKWEYCRF